MMLHPIHRHGAWCISFVLLLSVHMVFGVGSYDVLVESASPEITEEQGAAYQPLVPTNTCQLETAVSEQYIGWALFPRLRPLFASPEETGFPGFSTHLVHREHTSSDL